MSVPMQKFNIIAQFSFDILLMQYCKLFLVGPSVPNQTNGINQIYLLMPKHMQKNQLHT